MGNQLFTLLRLPCMRQAAPFLSCSLKIPFINGFWQFDYKESCCGYHCYGCVELLECADSHPFTNLGSVYYYVFKNVFSTPFSSFWNFHDACVTVLDGTLQTPEIVYFSYFCSSDLVIPTDLYYQVCWFFPLLAQICYWALLVNFSFELLDFSIPQFLFGSI